ncbi:hypothetical protein PCANB_000048 [Pneumocystis canis]|nr:hypothetical protein PCANB_000048 [Pneumocystis canis]
MSNKRIRDDSEIPKPDDGLTSSFPSSLPPSSPPMLDRLDISENEALIDDMIDDLDEAVEEEDGEDLFGENMERDYMQNLELDHYDIEELDDEGEYEAMDPALRRQVEAKLRKRDLELSRTKGLHKTAAFLQDDEEDSFDFSMMRRRRRHYDDRQDNIDEDFVNELTLDALLDIKADSMSEWILTESVQRTISREFRTFLLEYTDDKGTSVYGNRIRTLGEINSESLEINYTHLLESKAVLAYFLVHSPSEILSIFDRVAMETTLLHYPDYERIHSEIHVRIIGLPRSFTLRELRQAHLNCLVKVSGVVTRRTSVFPQLKYVKFNCQKCGIVLGPFSQDSNMEIKIGFCHNCQSKGPFSLNSEKTIYRNYQKMTLQESPGTVSPGRLPRHREIILLWDLIDSAKPGEEIEVTGIYRNSFDASLNVKNGFPVFATIIEANHINKTYDQFLAFKLTEDDEKAIKQLSKSENIEKRQAIACSLFGGVPKDINGKHSIRGDINVLLLGDPGTAKSQFLKYVEKVAHRAVFATGQGASAVGLTASVRKDPVTGEWTLEGGALVLADKGVCLIDEFDKMNDRDRTSIHEAMEQQSISISKAGIVTTLQARCSILAAANPIGGRYNTTLPFNQNVELTEPILSRFDILNVVKDTVDPEGDERLANFVIKSHLKSHPYYTSDVEDSIHSEQFTEGIEPIPQSLLRKYIMYAREYIHPKLHQMDQDKISKLYSDMRRESLVTGSYPITVRHLESIIRISEAFAKMHLSEYVKTQHIDAAIKVIVDSFVSAQKLSVKKSLSRENAERLLIKQGAESLTYKTLFLPEVTCLLKIRLPKPYRHPILDERLTKHRICVEARLLYKCYKGGVSCPAIYFVDLKKGELWSEWIEGKTLKDELLEWENNINIHQQDYIQIMTSIGRNIGQMHQLDVVHGDLTTSNIMVRPSFFQKSLSLMTSSQSDRIVIIDFGLGSVTHMIEDKAVDLYVLERTFESTHPQSNFLFKYVLDAYSKSWKDAKHVLHRLKEGKVFYLLVKWFTTLNLKEKARILKDVSQIVLQRRSKACNFLEYKDEKICYRRYASLFFILGIEQTDNELITLEIIHRYVEALDRYFGNVCELDIIFNFQKAYFILDELIMAGEMQESSKKAVLKIISDQDTQEELEKAEDSLGILGTNL